MTQRENTFITASGPGWLRGCCSLPLNGDGLVSIKFLAIEPYKWKLEICSNRFEDWKPTELKPNICRPYQYFDLVVDLKIVLPWLPEAFVLFFKPGIVHGCEV